MFQIWELLNFIADIEWNNNSTATLFFLVKEWNTEGNFNKKVKKVNITEETQNDLHNKYLKSTKTKLSSLEQEWIIKNIDDFDDNPHNFYYFNNEQLNNDLKFITQINYLENETYIGTSNDKIEWIILRIENYNDKFDIFIPHYPVNNISPDRFLLRYLDDQFEKINLDKIIQFWENIFLIHYRDKTLCFNFSKLEKGYWYTKELNNKAHNKLEKINNLWYIDNFEVLEWFIDEDKTLRNKVLKIQENSPIFTAVSFNNIKDFVLRKPKLKIKINSEWTKFLISSKKDASNLITVLNDDILKSELTNMEYEVENKNNFS